MSKDDNISYKVMKTDVWQNAILYRIACCGDQDHDMTLEIEWDSDIRQVCLNFYKKLRWSAYWGTDNWFKSQWVKLKAIYRIVFFGYIEVEESLLIDEPEHIENFIKALEYGKEYLIEKHKITLQ